MPRDLQIIRTCSETISTSPIFFLQCFLKGSGPEYEPFIFTLQGLGWQCVLGTKIGPN